ncbi:hypothetical protein MUO79_03760 [Candidatus Bathyarchaeota archaeon]|nr:hypothetical protein [Candidatus Bathyarchaeota archaeon]
MNNSGKNTFYDDMLKGNAHKNIIKNLLEKSGYKVYPFGYETLLSDVKSRLTKDTKNSRTVRRIRSSPDLLVYDEQKNDLMLVEVKMRTSCPPRIKPRLIERYKEFWDDSILVIVVKEGNVFYAQRISELETRPEYYRIADFEKLQDIFTRVNEEDILHYKEIALQTMQTQKGSSIDEREEED